MIMLCTNSIFSEHSMTIKSYLFSLYSSNRQFFLDGLPCNNNNNNNKCKKINCPLVGT